MKADKPILSQRAFWDVDMNKIDYEKDPLFVLERVICFGELDDFFNLEKFYYHKRMRKEIVFSKNSANIEFTFCATAFKLKLTDCIHYNHKLINPRFMGYDNVFSQLQKPIY